MVKGCLYIELAPCSFHAYIYINLSLAPVYTPLYHMYTGLILGLRPANERRRYKVTPSLIGWAQT